MFNPIMRFNKDYEWLSNMFPAKIKLQGHTWPSAENFYQSKKGLPQELPIFLSCSPCESKSYWRTSSPRNGDFQSYKVQYMRAALYAKFTQNKNLAKKLVYTRDRTLVEGNWWGDTFWGYCLKTERGNNVLGQLLMEVRGFLSNPENQRIDLPIEYEEYVRFINPLYGVKL